MTRGVRTAACAASLSSAIRRLARVLRVLPPATPRISSARATSVCSKENSSCGLRNPRGPWPASPTATLRSQSGARLGGSTPHRLERVSCAAILILIALPLFAAPKKPAPLPVLGTMLKELPAGKMKAVADRACLNCHSSDMLRQQRLTEKQWTAELTKMGNWGSDLKNSEKEELLAYLVKNFGPDNDRFEPVATKPAAPPPSSRRR